MIKNKNGITLIALIITIIILLILAGVAIARLGGENGLMTKTKQSAKKYEIAQAKEKIEIKVIEFKSSNIENSTLEEFEKYLSEDIQNSVYGIEKIYNDLNEIENFKITDLDIQYTFLMDKELNIVENNETIYKTEATYEIIEELDNQLSVKILIKNDNGIEQIIYPNGNIFNTDGKKLVSINYVCEKNMEYQFKVKINDKEEIYTLNTMDTIKIDENTSYAYPIITKYGVEIGKSVNIDYIQGGENYYSLDDGKTWKKYEGSIKLYEAKNIKAKSVIDSKITQIVTKNITLELAEDSMGIEAYDNSLSTYAIPLNKYMELENDIIGYNLRLSINCPAYNHVYIAFYKEDKTTSVGENGYWHTSMNGTGDLILTVPEEAKYVKVITVQGYSDLAYLYDIELDTKPVGNILTLYPNITTEGITFKDRYTIKYFETAIKKLYSYDNKEWYDYTEDGVLLEYGETIYAKSIDINGKESKILTYQNELSDILGKEAYDNDEETKTFALNKLIYVQDSMWNKKIELKIEAPLYSRINTRFLDEDKEILDSFDTINTTAKTEVEIPEKTKWITFAYTDGDGAKGNIYEIKVIQ